MLSVIDRLSVAFDRALLVIGCGFLALMVLHITIDVLLRALFNAAVVGTLESVSYYHIVFAVFLPLAYVERRGEHIRVDLFVQKMPLRVQFALYLFACLIGLGFFGALTYQSFLDALRSTERQETIMSNFLFYIWPSRWALPLGFGAACLAILNAILKALVRRQSA
jgi:TRAP-type C4-dicarboxylate transport system permease small subunit